MFKMFETFRYQEVQIKSISGEYEKLRALIDSGSQATIISEESVEILKLPRLRVTTKISGVSKNIVHLTIKTKNPFKDPLKIEAIVLPKLMQVVGNCSFCDRMCCQFIYPWVNNS